MPEEYLSSLDPSDRLPMWRGILDSERVAVFLALNDGEPIGFSCGGPSSDADADGATGELWSIYLLREFWGLGIGRSLHDQLLSWLGDCGFQRATLWVLEANDRTRRWYERQGWEAEGSRKTVELWGTPLTEIRYGKELR